MFREDIADEVAYFVHSRTAFTVEELVLFAARNLDPSSTEGYLRTDNRFVTLGGKDGNHFISKSVLLRWLVYLNLRLARAHLSRLTRLRFIRFASSLRHTGSWAALPDGLIDFGGQYGLVAEHSYGEELVFPLAHIASFLNPRLAASALEMALAAQTGLSSLPSCSATVDRETNVALAGLDGRSVEVFHARGGIADARRSTLEAVGKRFGITRERVRQIELLCHHAIMGKVRAVLSELLGGLFLEIMVKKGSLIADAADREAPYKGYICEVAGIPLITAPYSSLTILGAATPQKAGIPEHRYWFPMQVVMPALLRHIRTNTQIPLVPQDVKAIAELIVEHRRPQINKTQKVYLALRQIGKPAHFSKVAEAYNAMYPNSPIAEHSAHVLLLREMYGVVWIGIKGTFALREWGYWRPKKSLFDAVADIVAGHYKRYRLPITFAGIQAEMGKLRRIVNPASLLLATTLNRRIQCTPDGRLVPASSLVADPNSDLSGDQVDMILSQIEARNLGKAPNLEP